MLMGKCRSIWRPHQLPSSLLSPQPHSNYERQVSGNNMTFPDKVTSLLGQ